MQYLTGKEAAGLLGISRNTLYRWHHTGRFMSWEWTEAQIEARRAELTKRKPGPARNPKSKRYYYGRHKFTSRNWVKASG